MRGDPAPYPTQVTTDSAALLLDQCAITFGEFPMGSARIGAGGLLGAYPLHLLALEEIVDVHASAPFRPGKGEREFMFNPDTPAGRCASGESFYHKSMTI
jgi:hypothetical protein